MNSFTRSQALMADASRFLAGGVSSNYRLGIAPTCADPVSVAGISRDLSCDLRCHGADRDFRDTFAVDRARYVRFTTAFIERGIRALERGAWFASTEHNGDVIDRTLDAVESAASVVT